MQPNPPKPKASPSMENDDYRILKELESLIEKTSTIPERKKIVQLYRQFTFFLQNNDECSAKEKDEYFKYVKQVEEYTKRSDALLEGGQVFSPEEVQRVKVLFDTDISKLQNIPIHGYWRDVMRNANVRWGPLDDELLETLARVDVHTKLNPENRNTEFVELKFVFDANDAHMREFANDNLWVRIIFKNDELSVVENSKIEWKDSKNPLNEDGKAAGVQIKNSILDLFTTKDFSIEDEVEDEDNVNGEEQIGQIDREDMEKMVDELVNVVSFSLEYFLGVQPVDEDDEDDFDDTEF